MSRVAIKLPKRLQRVEIITAKEIAEKGISFFIPKVEPKELPEETPEKKVPEERPILFKFKSDKLLEDISKKTEIVTEEEPVKEEIIYEKPVFSEEFTFTHSNEPIEISLKNVTGEIMTIEEVKKEVQEAYDQGFKDGKEVTQSSFGEELHKHQEWIRNFDSVVQEFKLKYFDEMKKFEDSLIPLALMIAEHLLRREISIDSNVIIEQTRKALEALDSEAVFKIHLHPDDIPALEMAKSSLVQDKSMMKDVLITQDSSVERGGCILETSAGVIDARIQTQLHRIENALTYAAKSTVEAAENQEEE